jgi:hypothetical protein
MIWILDDVLLLFGAKGLRGFKSLQGYKMSRYDKIIQRFSRRLNQIEEDLREKRFAESDLEREGQKIKSATGFVPRLSEFEYYQAQELKEELAERYRDQSLNKVIPGEKISNQYGKKPWRSLFFPFSLFSLESGNTGRISSKGLATELFRI